ncbi:MAG: hypothetical protein ACE5D1_03380 [Fidelibacterota bacterium]
MIINGLVLALATMGIYLLFPTQGYRRWDSLMSATILHDWASMPGSVIFFFAHTLVLPFSKAVSLLAPGVDPIVTVSLREILFASLNSALLFLGLVGALGPSRAAFWLTAITISFHGRWMFATQGEEKEILLFFQQITVLATFSYLRWIKLPEWTFPFSIPFLREIVLGFLLTLSVMAHLENGLMVITIAIVLGASAVKKRIRWSQFLMVGFSAVFLGFIWFGFLIVSINGIRTLSGAFRWLFEYHATGEFISVTPHFFNQALEAWSGFRRLLIGERAGEFQMAVEMTMGLGFLGITLWKAWKNHRKMTGFFMLFLGLMNAHFFFWLPWDPEQWVPTVMAGTFLVGLGWFHGKKQPGLTVLVLPVIILFLVNGFWYLRESKYFEPYRLFRVNAGQSMGIFSDRFLRSSPYPNLVTGLKPYLSHDTVVLVDQRHLANHLRIYSLATPIDYLDQNDSALKNKYLLTQMSLVVYRPKYSTVELRAKTAAGDTVYYLTDYPRAGLVAALNAEAIPLPGTRCVDFQLWRLKPLK